MSDIYSMSKTELRDFATLNELEIMSFRNGKKRYKTMSMLISELETLDDHHTSTVSQSNSYTDDSDFSEYYSESDMSADTHEYNSQVR